MTRRHGGAIAFSVALALVQMMAAPKLRLWGAHPDLLFCTMLFFALTARPAPALAAAWALGLLKSIGSAGTFGFDSLLFVGLTAGVLLIRNLLYVSHPLSQILLTLPLAFLTNIGYALQRVTEGSTLAAGPVAEHAAITAVYTAVATPWVFLIFALIVGVPPTVFQIRTPKGG